VDQHRDIRGIKGHWLVLRSPVWDRARQEVFDCLFQYINRMASLTRHNTKNPGVKRILQEAREIANDPSPELTAAPLEDDLFQWHFTIRVPHSEFDGGIYHGRILLPAEYPLRPPEVLLMTPNGRFALNQKICLTITGFHEDMWQPAWGIRTALTGLIAFFATEAKGAIGGLDTPAAERKRLAKFSRDWMCPTCRTKNLDILPDVAPKAETSTTPTVQSESSIESPAPLPNISITPADLSIQPTSSTLPQIPDNRSNLTLIASTATSSNPTSPSPPALANPPQVQSVTNMVTDLVIPHSVAPVMVPSSPTWLDRLIISLLILMVGLAARGLTS